MISNLFLKNYPKSTGMILDFIFVVILYETYRYFNFSSLFLVERSNLIISILIFIFLSRVSGIYDSRIRFFNFLDLIHLTLFIISCAILTTSLGSSFSMERFLINIFTFSLATIPYRLIVKYLYSLTTKKNLKRVAIYGAGRKGVILKRAFYNSSQYHIVGFIDDDPLKVGRRIDGVYVHNFSEETLDFLKRIQVEAVIFSTKNIGSPKKEDLITNFSSIGIKVYNVPILSNILNNNVNSLAKLKEIKIEDLLSRKEIKIDKYVNQEFFRNKTVAITGGAGSIGSEILRQLSNYDPKVVIVIDTNETALFHLQQEFLDYKNFKFKLINVLNEESIHGVFTNYSIDYIFHAAAYKHVSIVEENPIEGLRNNILGTLNLLKASQQYSIEKFVLVSTDKAVNPTNVMGASKRFCELLVSIYAEKKLSTNFVTTRFGNVLGSNGSVIPIFKKQISEGGPLLLTHPEITRYFMTIPEAAQLVLEACRLGNDNQVFVFDMGTPVKIYDLARKMILLSGHETGQDIEIKIIGLRKGEKLYEELLLDTEKMNASKNSHIFIADKEYLSEETEENINLVLRLLSDQKFSDENEIIGLIKQIIPEFKSNNSRFELLDNS